MAHESFYHLGPIRNNIVLNISNLAWGTLFSFYKNSFYKNHWGSDLVQIFTENGEELIDWKENFAKRNSTSKEAF